MLSNTNTPQTYYTCAYCGASVPIGSTHNCQSFPAFTPNGITWMQAQEIISLLKDILNKLDELRLR